jgi:putative Holliday junction resolvase
MRVVGLDVGERRIGVAVSDPGGRTAQPLTVVQRKSDEQAVAEIVKIINDYEAGGLIYGMPLEEDGDYGEQANATEEFIGSLRQSLEIPITGQDERYTTIEAEKILIAQDVPRKRRREIIDKIAASIILQGYLDRSHEQSRKP